MDINLLTSLSDNIRIDKEKCTACGRCLEVCILDNLRLNLSPCRQACPLGMNCQGYIRHLAAGEPEKGVEKVRESAPFAGILGRVCSRPCEAACSRLKVDGEAVAIRDLKRFLADGDESAWPPPPAAGLPGKVAIAGAGPAGLTAAFHLRLAGFQVLLFDREHAPGGLMRWGIPEFRLPMRVLEKELRFLDLFSVEFTGGRVLGKDLDPERLGREFDAVLLALGAHGQVRLGLPGENSPAIVPALDFMKRAREKKGPFPGARVIVIGGGNAAVDAAQTALRLGAKKVHLVSLEKREEMPAFPWNLSEAEEEGVAVQNGWGPREFRFAGKRLSSVSFKKCVAVCDARGCFCPDFDERTALDLPADMVITAIGQRTETIHLDPSWAGPAGISPDPLTLRIGQTNFFAAGDCVTGPKTVVEAMSQGKEAAVSIQRLLQGEDLAYGRRAPILYETQFEADLSRAKTRPRTAMPVLPLMARKRFEEVGLGYGYEEARAEAERCLNCGLPFGLRTCWFCLPCEIECPEKALYVEIPYLLR